MSDLVRNPEDRFSHNEARIIMRLKCIRPSPTHLAYIANVRKLCNMKQKIHSSESMCQLTSIATEKMTSVMAIDGIASF